MKKRLVRFITERILGMGYFITSPTAKKRVQSLINLLHPLNVGIDLIRLGAERDGGYLVPNDLEGIEACFSPGVNEMSEFDISCSKLGMHLFLADKSVEKPNFNLTEDKYNFLKKFVGCINNEDYITMDKWVNSSDFNNSSDLLLQMDIEGAEYLSIPNMSESLMNKFRIMVIEFHFLDKIWSEEYFFIMEQTFKKILQTHTCVHIHPNNYVPVNNRLGVDIPHVLEITFIRNDRIKQKKYRTTFPHPLDADNSKRKKPVVLPKNWYHSS